MPVEKAARKRIEEILRRGRVPGCSLAIADRAGNVRSDAFGFADVRRERATTADTSFHLFSGTKLYTAAAVMILQERGQLSLDEPVATYLGELPLRHSITVRQLASHDSGLRDTLAGFFAVHVRDEPMPSTADALGRYRLGRGKRPGSGAQYRNVNYAILGELISRVSGQPYIAFVRATLLDPLGARVAFQYDDELAEHEAVGYSSRSSPMRLLLRMVVPGLLQRIEGARVGSLVELSSFALDTAAIGGLVGSARQFIPFVSEFLSNDDGVLTAESKRAMLTVQAKGRAGIASKVGVGLGWKLGRLDSGIEFWNHEGGGPGFTSETRIYPSERLGIVVLMNTTHSSKLSWLTHEICEVVRATE
jgi:CubicO group peptidase (beta-lactamase class C family)